MHQNQKQLNITIMKVEVNYSVEIVKSGKATLIDQRGNFLKIIEDAFLRSDGGIDLICTAYDIEGKKNYLVFIDKYTGEIKSGKKGSGIIVKVLVETKKCYTIAQQIGNKFEMIMQIYDNYYVAKDKAEEIEKRMHCKCVIGEIELPII